MHLQVWVNRHSAKLNEHLLRALGSDFDGATIRWVSPLEKKNFREYRDGAFLQAIELSEHRAALQKFWPKGGPVWDGLAIVSFGKDRADAILLIEAKSYPEEVRGSGCQATPDSDSRRQIESSLSQAAEWTGVARKASWIGALYQSANRIAHTLFLRKTLGCEAYMMNVCFVDDPRRSTSEAAWVRANEAFKDELGLSHVDTPWLMTILVPAASRADLLASAT